jgi:hypothetical protein
LRSLKRGAHIFHVPAMLVIGLFDLLAERAHALFERVVRLRLVVSFAVEARRQIGDGVFDGQQAVVDDAGIAGGRLELGHAIFQPRHGAAGLRFAFGEAGGQTVDGVAQLAQRLRRAIVLFERRDAFVGGGELGLQRARAVLGLVEPAGERLHVLRQRRDLIAGLLRRLRDLIGQTRQARMQAFHRVLQIVSGGVLLDARQPVGQGHHMAVELIEGLGLLARGDVDLRGGFAHGAVVFGLAALGGVEPACDPLQMILDPPRGRLGLVLAARDARQHVFGVAGGLGGAVGDGAIGIRARGCRLAPVLGRAFEPACGLRKSAQDLPRQPFADRKPITPGRGTGGFARLRRYPSHIPGQIRLHIDSPLAAPQNRVSAPRYCVKKRSRPDLL